MKRLHLPRSESVLFILLFASALAAGPQLINTDGDLPRHLLMGKYVLENGAPPTSEIFAYPYAGREYVPHEWLAGVTFYLAYLALDLNGVVLLAGILIGWTFTLAYSRARANNGEALLSFLLVLLGAVVTSIHLVARPHLFTMLFLVLWLTWLDRLNRGEMAIVWPFPVSMLLWANIHAEYIVGFLALLACLAGSVCTCWRSHDQTKLEKFKVLLRIGVLSSLASLLNPSGLKAWTTVAGYVNNSYLMSRISETRPPNVLAAESAPLLTLLLLSILLVAFRKGNFKPADLLLIAGFGFMSILSTRNAHLFGVAAPLLLSHGLKGMRMPQSVKNVEAMFARLESQARGVAAPIILSIVSGALLLSFPLRNYNRFDPAIFPVDAVRWLKDNPQTGRMFNAFDWGGYILFHLWPAQQVFIESQTDTTGEITRLYESVVTLRPGWENIFLDYEIKWAIIPPGWKLTRVLKGMGWTVVYEDGTTVILAGE